MSLKNLISAPLEAGPSILDAHRLPAVLEAALDYASQRLARRNISIDLVVLRRTYQLPSEYTGTSEAAAGAAAAGTEAGAVPLETPLTCCRLETLSQEEQKEQKEQKEQGQTFFIGPDSPALDSHAFLPLSPPLSPSQHLPQSSPPPPQVGLRSARLTSALKSLRTRAASAGSAASVANILPSTTILHRRCATESSTSSSSSSSASASSLASLSSVSSFNFHRSASASTRPGWDGQKKSAAHGRPFSPLSSPASSVTLDACSTCCCCCCGPSTPGTPAMPATPATPALSIDSSHTTESLLSCLSSPSPSPYFGQPQPQQHQQHHHNPPPFIRLVYADSLSCKDRKSLHQALEKAARRFHLCQHHLPPPVPASELGLPGELMDASARQNDVLFFATSAAAGLTLRAADHLYSFKAALCSYARTGDGFRLEDAVDELRRYVLVHSGSRAQSGRRQGLPKRELLRRYRSPSLDAFSEAQLDSVRHMYSRAYGSGTLGAHGAEDYDCGIETDGLTSSPPWVVDGGWAREQKGEEEEKEEEEEKKKKEVIEDTYDYRCFTSWFQDEDEQSTPIARTAEEQERGDGAGASDSLQASLQASLADALAASSPITTMSSLSTLLALPSASSPLILGLSAQRRRQRSLSEPMARESCHVKDGGQNAAAGEECGPVISWLDDEEDEDERDAGSNINTSNTSNTAKKGETDVTAAVPIVLTSTPPPSQPLPSPLASPKSPLLPVLRLQTNFTKSQPAVTIEESATSKSNSVDFIGDEKKTDTQKERKGEVRKAEDEEEQLTARPVSYIRIEPDRGDSTGSTGMHLPPSTASLGQMGERLQEEWNRRRAGVAGCELVPITPNGYDDISPITRSEWGFLMTGGRTGRQVVVTTF